MLATLAALLLAVTPASAWAQGSAANVPARGPGVPPRVAPGLPVQGIALDFPRGTGAALLRRGETVLAVFDSPDLRNPETLRHPALA
ncbi:MAG TPA: hypothetical protein VEX11_11885, partial [Acetobacteraceae bacterium]|nr:hypothetical protein [Acetobacteraceae bacterium]